MHYIGRTKLTGRDKAVDINVLEDELLSFCKSTDALYFLDFQL